MQFVSPPSLDSSLFKLRPRTEEDISCWASYLNLQSVYEHTSWNYPSEAELKRYLGNESTMEPSSLLRLAIATKPENKLAGTVGFHTVSPVNQTAELAYDLNPAFWGKGLAKLVGDEMVRWAHAEAQVLRVQATGLESNARSIATLERMGFLREGLLRSYKLVRGQPGNFYMYAHVAAAR